jgi:hypothetical protein
MTTTIKMKFVAEVTVQDPDSHLPVEITIYKMETGPMVGVDTSYLLQDVGPLWSPYDESVNIEESGL